MNTQVAVIITISVVATLLISGCVDVDTGPPIYTTVVASISIPGYKLNYSEVQNINYTNVKVELERQGYMVGTYLNDTLPERVDGLVIPKFGGGYWLIALRVNDTNFTHAGIVYITLSGGKNQDGNMSASTDLSFSPTGVYPYNETNIAKDIAYLRLKAKEVFQICNVTADVDNWKLYANIMT